MFEQFREEYPWQVIATGPCHGIQSSSGRLIVPVWLATDKSHRPSVVSSIYSDDCGEHWQRGELIHGSEDLINPNETAAVQLSDGRILFNMRNESPVRRRSVAVSGNGAEGWTVPRFDPSLPDPICCGSITSMDCGGKRNILFCNCANEKGRYALTLHRSCDDCATWDDGQVVQSGGAGYSDLAADGDNIYVLYERFFEGGTGMYLTFVKY